MKKIIWITANYFSQVDIPILPDLNKKFDIEWFIYARKQDKSIDLMKKFAIKNNISLNIFSSLHPYNPLSIIYLIKMLIQTKKQNADLVYFNIVAFPFLAILIPPFIKLKKVILAMHHGHIHDGMRLKFFYKYYLKAIPYYYQNFLYFSESQAKFFPVSLTNKKKYVIPLATNNFGDSKEKPADRCINFLSFGVIINTKNIELLINASCKLYEEIGNKFHVTIAGQCNSWESNYAPLIKYPKIFTLKITRLTDSEIPDLFCSNHYLVLPYKAVTQSGPLRIAYSYNIPVLASNLDGFKESIVENTTGIFFESDNEMSLLSKMKMLVQSHNDLYPLLKQKQKQYVEQNLSHNIIINKYIKLFNEI